MDLLATHPTSHALTSWQQDRLILQTVGALNKTYKSPYERHLDFTLSQDIPAEERAAMEAMLGSLHPGGVPDTIAYLTEDELFKAMPDLETLGYHGDGIRAALFAPPQSVEYYHHFFRP
jgi:hypothetical protein